MKVFKFEEYTLLNESFKSSKLKDILQQHGMPEYSADNVFLYDLDDSEILGVALDYNELDNFKDNDTPHYHIKLEDGSYLVLGNIETLSHYAKDDDFQKEFKKRRDERHPGNEFNDGPKYAEDSAVKHLRDKKDELIHSRCLTEFKRNLGDVEEFTKLIRSYFESNIDENAGEIEPDSNKTLTYEFDVDFNDQNYTIIIDYKVSSYEPIVKYGVELFDATFTPTEITVCNDDDCFDVKEFIEDPDFGKEFWEGLYNEYKKEDIEGEIKDYYNYYGVSRGDFF